MVEKTSFEPSYVTAILTRLLPLCSVCTPPRHPTKKKTMLLKPLLNNNNHNSNRNSSDNNIPTTTRQHHNSNTTTSQQQHDDITTTAATTSQQQHDNITIARQHPNYSTTTQQQRQYHDHIQWEIFKLDSKRFWQLYRGIVFHSDCLWSTSCVEKGRQQLTFLNRLLSLTTSLLFSS